MNVNDILRETRRIADQDDSILLADVQDWVDAGINRINQACQANIPTISSLPATTVPSFDPRYHEILVMFCVMKYREGDSDYTAAQYFQKQFEEMLAIIQRDMSIPPSLHDGPDWMQLTATSDGQITFSLTNLPTGLYFSQIEVYQNDNRITEYCTFDSQYDTMTVDAVNVAIKANDKISLNFFEDGELISPTYEWWGQTNW